MYICIYTYELHMYALQYIYVYTQTFIFSYAYIYRALLAFGTWFGYVWMLCFMIFIALEFGKTCGWCLASLPRLGGSKSIVLVGRAVSWKLSCIESLCIYHLYYVHTCTYIYIYRFTVISDMYWVFFLRSSSFKSALNDLGDDLSSTQPTTKLRMIFHLTDDNQLI